MNRISPEQLARDPEVQREIARQQKQKEKAARRAEAKQMKDDAPPDIRPEDRDADDSQPIVAATDQAVPEEEGSR